MTDQDTIRNLAAAVVEELAAGGRAVCTAESCTGGWIAKSITDIPGASAVFHYGIVSYSNGAKESLLGVGNGTLARFGSVSEAVVREMAEGAVRLSGADIGVAVSGVAGPDGGSEEKPVGTVWFAWAMRNRDKLSVDTDRQRFDGNRERVRALTVVYALQGVLDRV